MIKKIVMSLVVCVGVFSGCSATEEASGRLGFAWLPGKTFATAEVKDWPIAKVYGELELSTKFEEYLLGMKSVSALCKRVNRTKKEFDPAKEESATRGVVEELFMEAMSGLDFLSLPSALIHVLQLIIFRRINVYALATLEEMRAAKIECYDICAEVRRQYSAVGGRGDGCSICRDEEKKIMGTVGQSLVLLRCFHSVCTDCAASLISTAGAGEVKCPLCREISPVESTRERLGKALANDRADVARATH